MSEIGFGYRADVGSFGRKEEDFLGGCAWCSWTVLAMTGVSKMMLRLRVLIFSVTFCTVSPGLRTFFHVFVLYSIASIKVCLYICNAFS